MPNISAPEGFTREEWDKAQQRVASSVGKAVRCHAEFRAYRVFVLGSLPVWSRGKR